MLYITERGSLEDSVTYKNITLKIRYKDDSLSKHRKAIAEALMTAGTVTKLRESNAQIPVVADDNIANEYDRAKLKKRVGARDLLSDSGKVSGDD